MSHGIRWIPAKPKGLGQAVSSPESTNEKAQGVMNTLVYGGLVLAGLALLWAVTMGREPKND